MHCGATSFTSFFGGGKDTGKLGKNGVTKNVCRQQNLKFTSKKGGKWKALSEEGIVNKCPAIWRAGKLNEMVFPRLEGIRDKGKK